MKVTRTIIKKPNLLMGVRKCRQTPLFKNVKGAGKIRGKYFWNTFIPCPPSSLTSLEIHCTFKQIEALDAVCSPESSQSADKCFKPLCSTHSRHCFIRSHVTHLIQFWCPGLVCNRDHKESQQVLFPLGEISSSPRMPTPEGTKYTV